MRTRRHFGWVSIMAALGLFVAAGAECPTDMGMGDNTNSNTNSNGNSNDNTNGNTNGNTNDNSNGNSNTGNNIFGASKTLLSRWSRSLLVMNNPQLLSGDLVTFSAELERPGLIEAIACNAKGHLLILTGSTLEIFETAESINTNTPTRTVTNDQFLNAESIAIDRTRDILYVGIKNSGASIIQVYEGTESEAFDGDVDFDRFIFDGTLEDFPLSKIAISDDDKLYVYISSKFLVWDNASTVDTQSGQYSPHDREFEIEFSETGSVAFSAFTIDPNDNLVLSVFKTTSTKAFRGIVSIPNAGTLEDTMTDPKFIRSEETGLFGGSMTLDAEGNAYLASSTGVVVYDSVVGRNGVEDPNRKFSSADDRLDGAPRLLIVE